MGMLALFYRLMVRPTLREPVRSLLILFAVTLGVSVVVAIDMAGNSAAGSFQASMETLAGDNDLEVTAAGGVPENVVGQLAQVSGLERVVPRIEDHATVVESGETIPLIGIDLIAEANQTQEKQSEIAAAGDVLTDINDPNAVWVTRGLRKPAGTRIQLLINDRVRAYIVRGIVPDSAGVSGNAILMDIGAAQEATGKHGRVDRILIKLPQRSDLNAWQTRLRAILPPGVLLSPQGAQTHANRRMLAAFRWNLRILSYIALLVGAFLIYNSISVSVVRRRAEIGIVRALGGSRSMVLWAFVLESVLFGVAGAALALPLGRLLAAGAVRLLATTVNALYVSSRPGALVLSPGTIALAFLTGIAVAVLSAFSPAREASLVSPTEAMARARREYEMRVHRGRDALLAGLLAALGTGCAYAPAMDGRPIFGYASALLFVAAFALIVPSVVYVVTRMLSKILPRILGAEALLASRSLAGSLRRTAVLVGALSTAIAMMTSVGIMVGSFRQTVVTWMGSELPADLYLRPAGGGNADQHPTIDPGLADGIAKVPGVESVSRFRAYEITYQGEPATLASVDIDLARPRQALSFLSGHRSVDVLRQMTEGDVAIVSEPFANKHHVKAGDTVTLALGRAQVPFRIADIFYDYGSEAGYIIVDRATLLHYLPDQAPTNLAVYLTPHADLEAARNAVKSVVAHHDILILSNREIRREAVRVFDQTFAITYSLEAVALIVAVLGIAGALVSIVIDRRRELAVLRFLGASSGQIRKMILCEAGLIGIFANLTGLSLGLILSLLLVFVINKQSFGWTIQFHGPAAILVGAITVVYGATVLAGLYPARMAERLNPIEAIHEE